MEIKTILEENDFSLVIEYNGSLGNNPNRGDFESVVNQVIGQDTPDRTMRFLVHSNNNKWFLVFYVKDQDKFLYEKLTAR